MNMKMCATSDVAKAWNSIDWNKANAYVKKLQMRIVKAHQQGRTGKVKSLQWLLTHSFYGRVLAVKRVTSNKGKKTAGVDKILWSTPKLKYEATLSLKRRGYKPFGQYQAFQYVYHCRHPRFCGTRLQFRPGNGDYGADCT